MSASVMGSDGQVLSLDYSQTNLSTAQAYAAALNQMVASGELVPQANNTVPPNPNPTGTPQFGYVETVNFQEPVTLTPGYQAAVLDSSAMVTGSPDTGQIIMGGSGNITYDNPNPNASGAVVLGNGNNTVLLTGTPNSGTWNVSVGDGDNGVQEANGNANIFLGTGSNQVGLLGTGDHVVSAGGPAGGSDTIRGSTGNDVITAPFDTNITFFGGSGTANVEGGAGANNVFNAGSGNETLIGGGAGPNGTGSNQFVFSASFGPAGTTQQDIIDNFGLGKDQVVLKNYGPTEVATALAGAKTTTDPFGVKSTTVGLSDGTTITFHGVGSLSAANFITQ